MNSMNNFLNFIKEDVEAKKTLISTMPKKTIANKKKYNQKIDIMKVKYKEYKISVRNYLLAKTRSFNIKNNDKDIEKLSNKVTNLEKIKFLLNPSNTCLEKMGFDYLLYEITNYYDFNFNSLNDIINKFLDKFTLAGINLNKDNFNYTCFVHEYMSAFFEEKNKKNSNYNKVSEMFERIYWDNPDIIQHIELNFRKLIKKYERNFNSYISKLQKQIMAENQTKTYIECLEKLKIAYIDLEVANKEDICDIIDLAKTGSIDMTEYFEGSKARNGAYDSLLIDSKMLEEKEKTDKFYSTIEKLKSNLDEYSNYIKFSPLIEDFKKTYEKKISTDEENNKKNTKLKEIEGQISNKESLLEKNNKKIFKSKPGIFQFKNDFDLKQLKSESIRLAKELYELYKEYDNEYFNNKVMSILNNSLTISDVLHLYYSFDYFKKLAIKRVFNLTNYEDLIKYSEEFDLFSMDQTNIIVNGVPLFEEINIPRIIVNKYRLDNINLTEDVLTEDSINGLISKILLILRIKKIEESPTTIEKIWFMAQVEKIIENENKNIQ